MFLRYDLYLQLRPLKFKWSEISAHEWKYPSQIINNVRRENKGNQYREGGLDM